MSKGTPSILSVLQDQVEPSIVAHQQNHGPRPVGWKRPFLETPSANRPPIAKSRQETATFPEKDESLGELVISYLGPPPSEFLERKVSNVHLVCPGGITGHLFRLSIFYPFTLHRLLSRH